MTSSWYSSHDQKNHAYLYAHVMKISHVAHHDKCYNHDALPTYHNSHAMFASSSTYGHGRSRPSRNLTVSHAPRKVGTSPTTIYQTCGASFVLSCKNAKVVARKLGSKCRETKLAFGFQNLL
jgi:hypothetical protein